MSTRNSSFQLLYYVLVFLVLFCFHLSGAQQLKIQSKVKLLALGDSYTVGESIPAAGSWPAQLIDSLTRLGVACYDPTIIATTGWTTDNLKAAIAGDNVQNEYNLVSLLIGVNNYYQGGTLSGYIPQFRDLLVDAIAFAKGKTSNVFVLSIPDYGYTPFGENMQSEISAGIAKFNFSNDSITKLYNVPYFNITPISQKGIAQPNLVASDGLHPSAIQYSQWIHLILGGSVLNTDPSDTSGVVTGLGENRAKLSCFPNPFHDFLNFESIGFTDDVVTFRLYNQLGQLLIEQTKTISNDSLQIQTSGLSPGFFCLSTHGEQWRMPVRASDPGIGGRSCAAKNGCHCGRTDCFFYKTSSDGLEASRVVCILKIN